MYLHNDKISFYSHTYTAHDVTGYTITMQHADDDDEFLVGVLKSGCLDFTGNEYITVGTDDLGHPNQDEDAEDICDGRDGSRHGLR